MIDNWEKLVELLKECEREYENFVNKTSFIPNKAEFVADHLIAHGVTLQDVPDNDVGKWISVKDRLPEESGTYIVTANDGHAQRVSFVLWQKKNRMWNLTGARSYWRVTHWQPMPQPPKGE